MKKDKIVKKVQNKKLGKSKKKIKVVKKILKVIVFIILILFILSLLTIIGVGVYYLGTSSKYNIQNVEVSGNSIYTSEEILEIAQVPIGKNLFRMSSKNIEKKIKELPYVSYVDVKKKPKVTVKIILEERVSKYLAYNKETDKYLRLDKHGIILEEVSVESKSQDELLVFGINFDDNLAVGKAIAQTEMDKLTTYEKVYEVYENANMDKKITNIEFKNGILILTLDYDINVIIKDDNNLEYNIGFLNNILKEITGKSGTIDMTKDNPVFTEKVK